MLPFYLMADTEGLRIVLSPVQLAAVLQGEDIQAHETLVNRLWGGAKIIGGALELVGGGALLLTPEPTMITKAGGVVLGAHGTDTFVAGVRQVWTGDQTATFTEQATTALARELGASDDAAKKTGEIVDVAVPLVVAAVAIAARIIAVRAGRIVLAEEEAAGGHTIARHVARSEAQLRTRLLAEPRIPAASSFTSLRMAETVVSDTLRANAGQIRAWAAAANSTRPLTLTYAGSSDIGYGVVRATGALTKMRKALIVLAKTRQAGKVYFVLTSYPTP